MPYRRKDSRVWWVSFTGPDGKRIRRSTGTTDRKEAEALEAKWKLEAFKAKQWDEKPGLSFEALVLEYLKAAADKRSAKRDRLSARTLREMFAGVDMATLQGSDIRAYIAKRKAEGVSNATINRELSFLSSAINFARRDLGYDLPNPVAGRKLREPEGRVRWITRAEAEALIRAAETEPKAPHLADFIRLALHTGMRRGEILGLEWRRIDLQAGLIHLEAEHTKAGKRRSVPINAIAREAILNRMRFRAQHCPATSWVFCNERGDRIKDVKRSFKTACRRAGIEDFRIHDLRHTCAAWLVSAGIPLTEVRDLLGHSTIKMTERYAHLAPENVRAAVRVLEAGHGHDPVTVNFAGIAKMEVSH